MECITLELNTDLDCVWCATTDSGSTCYVRGGGAVALTFAGGGSKVSLVSLAGFTGADKGRKLRPLFSAVVQVVGPGPIKSARHLDVATSDPAALKSVLTTTCSRNGRLTAGPLLICRCLPGGSAKSYDAAAAEEARVIATRYAADLRSAAETKVYNALRLLQDWRPSVPSITCMGQPYAIPFAASLPYIVQWASDSVALVRKLALRPGCDSILYALDGEPANALWESLYAATLTTMCGPYETEPDDSRDSPLLNLGMRDDCDGASQVGTYIHKLMHTLPIVEYMMTHGCTCGDENVYHMTLAIVQWVRANTTARSLCALCYADPERAANSTAAAWSSKGLSMHMCMLVERKKPARTPDGKQSSLFLVETTGYIATRNSFPHDLVDRNPVSTSLGYSHILKWDSKKYPSFLLLRDQSHAYACRSTHVYLPGQGCVETLVAYPSSRSVALRSTSVPDVVPRIDTDTYLALLRSLFPRKVASVSSLSGMVLSPWSTALPGHMASDQQLMQVGPYVWFVADHDPEAHKLLPVGKRIGVPARQRTHQALKPLPLPPKGPSNPPVSTLPPLLAPGPSQTREAPPPHAPNAPVDASEVWGPNVAARKIAGAPLQIMAV